MFRVGNESLTKVAHSNAMGREVENRLKIGTILRTALKGLMICLGKRNLAQAAFEQNVC